MPGREKKSLNRDIKVRGFIALGESNESAAAVQQQAQGKGCIGRKHANVGWTRRRRALRARMRS